MNASQKALTLFFLTTATAAHADQIDDMGSYLQSLTMPEYVVQDAVNDTRFVLFPKKLGIDNTSIRHEAMVDYTRNLICEWDIVTVQGQEPKAENMACLAVVDDAPVWTPSYIDHGTDEVLLPTVINAPWTTPEDLGEIFESSVGVSFRGEAYAVLRAWNLSENEVCVVLGRQTNYDAEHTIKVDLGCHPVQNPEYQRELMRSVGMQPA